MATTADFKNGLYISYNGKPCQVVYFQHVKPGKGPAFVKTKLRNLENGRILENTFTAGMKIDVINVERRPYQFLYSDEDGFNFMHEETYEQIHLPHDVVENSDLMKDRRQDYGSALHQPGRQDHRQHHRPFLRPESVSDLLIIKKTTGRLRKAARSFFIPCSISGHGYLIPYFLRIFLIGFSMDLAQRV